MPFGDMGPDEDLLGVDCTEVFPGHPGRGWMWRSREPPWLRRYHGASGGIYGNQRWGGWDLNGFESLPGFS